MPDHTKDLSLATGQLDASSPIDRPAGWKDLVGEQRDEIIPGVAYTDNKVRTQIGRKEFTFNKSNKGGEQTIVASALSAALSEQLFEASTDLHVELNSAADGIENMKQAGQQTMLIMENMSNSYDVLAADVKKQGEDIAEMKADVAKALAGVDQCLAILELLKVRPTMSAPPQPGGSSGNKEGKAKVEPSTAGGGGPSSSKGKPAAAPIPADEYFNRLAALRAKAPPKAA